MNADVIIQGNNIFTGRDNQTMKGFIAIKDKSIVAVDTGQNMDKYIGNGTKVFRFDNELITPGFHDFHIHLFLGSLSHDSVSVHEARSEREAAVMVKQFADSRPDDPWVLGFNWYHPDWNEAKLPTFHSLDELIPNRPVLVLNAEGHSAWLNSKALDVLGIDEHTPNPPSGEISRDEHGNLTGLLYEGAIRNALPAFQLPRQRRVSIFKKFLAQAAKLGVTGVSDMFAATGYELGDLGLYREFEQNGTLTTRINFLTALDGDLDRARTLRNTYTSSLLRFSGLKQFLDGVPTTYTALMVEPYADNLSTKGEPFLPPEMIEKWVLEADRDGFRVRLHACGDGAVRLGLDVYETAKRKNGRRDSRHTIEHIEVIHPDDIKRFGQLGVIASMQPAHMALTESFTDNAYLNRLGLERQPFTWPIKSLVQSGAPMALGSDFPVVELNPMLEIYRAVTRLHNDGEPKGGWNPAEKITLAEALRYYTLGTAYGNFMEDVLGTIEVGKYADVVVMDRNLFATELEEMLEAKVKLTILNGQVIYED
ncbi:hypothetical protein J22TS1_23290 [Siminovitchia terrae]|uniref:amidohydrolase n=1 Tax=Siminovitchia terrae TaxID=1914933 RepID=UPI001B13B16A|nr:amidohydrolase [Siminovitchia terrae]GIN91278.1 hypothetical protein J22TS1_23290 [Siminovitchia terrae]